MRLTTLEVAAWGALTGTAALVLNGSQRREQTWIRRAKGASEVRAALESLRDTMVLARAKQEEASTPRATANLEVLEEHARKSGDRSLRRLLGHARTACAHVAGAGRAYALEDAIDAALQSLKKAMDRLDKIERKSPGSG